MRALLPLLGLLGCEPELASQAPSLTALSPPLVCGEQLTTTVTVSGTNLTPLPTDVLGEPTLLLPDLSLALDSDLSGAALDGRTVDIDEAPGSATRWIDSGTMSFEITPDLGLEQGFWTVAVANPDGQSATLPGGLVSIDAPVITSVEPDQICVESEAVTLTITGQGFLSYGGALPTVMLDDNAYPAETIDGCTPLVAPPDTALCTTLTVTVPANLYSLGVHNLAVTNPEPAACSSSEPITVEVIPPPELLSVEPDEICDTGGEIALTGTGFVEGMTVTVAGVAATEVVVESDTSATATLEDELPVGVVDVTIAVPGGCEDTLEAAITVVAAPLLYYVDPPVTYSGVAIEATLYLADVTGAITDVTLVDEAGTETPLSFSWTADDPDTARAIVPAGLPEGPYDVEVVQDDTCPVILGGGLVVEADTTVSIEGVEPQFAWTDAATSVSITGEDPTPSDMVPFEDVPRVYLSVTGSAATATALRSVSWASPTLLRAVVPAGLTPDTYDVIVVNPDGAVGWLPGGLEVTSEPPPEVDSISPGSIPSGGDQPVTLYGAEFRDPSVDFDCYNPGDGTTTTGAGTVTSSTDDAIEVDVPTDTLGSGVCVVRVTNSDGPWVDFSALSITNPAQNLYPWTAGTSMSVARRAPAVVAGRATTAARYLYAIGGDDGDEAGALDSIELASMDARGALGEWSVLPDALPEARTLAAIARVERFVYLIGGSDGGAAVDTVWRAQVLDPQETPGFADLSVDYATDSAGLGGGTWIYRVAALYPADDETNPGGESLAGDPVVVRLPALELGFELTLTWTEVDRASGYRVYRTPAADTGSGSEEWLADVEGALSYTDAGGATDSSRAPLPEGALGAWSEVATLDEPALSPCATTATDPEDPSLVYLFVAGGQDASGAALDAIWSLPLTLVDEHDQRVGSFTSAGEKLTEAAWSCGAWSADASANSVVPEGETWVYFGGGHRSSSRTTGELSAGRVEAGGSLADWTAVETMNPDRAGFGLATASNFLYAFGGQNGSPSAGGKSSEILEPPTLDNWNSLGTSMAEDRYLCGSASESSVIFVVGGATSTADATATTDQANY